jgi:hypothetical protein
LLSNVYQKTLYPNTKIHVRRKKVEGTLMTYTNELEVEIDFSDVNPNLLDESDESIVEPVASLIDSEENSDNGDSSSNSPFDEPNFGLGKDKPELITTGQPKKFFKK